MTSMHAIYKYPLQITEVHRISVGPMRTVEVFIALVWHVFCRVV